MEIKLNLEEVAEFVTITSKYKSDIDLRLAARHESVDAKSFISVLNLDTRWKLVVKINTEDNEEETEFYKEMEKYKVEENNGEV
jgi:phosphotransferase system HPr-like phosphotransfer protein